MNNRLTLTTLAIATIGISLAATAPAHASGGLLDKCQNFASRYGAEKCCSAWIKTAGTPWWFGDTGTCKKSVSCVRNLRTVGAALALKKKCGLELRNVPNGDNGSKPTPPPVRTFTLSVKG